MKLHPWATIVARFPALGVLALVIGAGVIIAIMFARYELSAKLPNGGSFELKPAHETKSSRSPLSAIP